MSAAVPRRPWRSRLISFLVLVGSLAAFHLISRATGFGDWLNGTPVAIQVVRVLAILFFGFCGLALLFLRDEEDGPRRIRNWLYGGFAIAMALLNAMLLIGGEDTISFSRE